MVLALDPSIRRVWRDPHTLQFGVERPRLVLHPVSSAEERMIAALADGIAPAGLHMIAARAHASPADVEALLERLRPVLVRGATEAVGGAAGVAGVAGAAGAAGGAGVAGAGSGGSARSATSARSTTSARSSTAARSRTSARSATRAGRAGASGTAASGVSERSARAVAAHAPAALPAVVIDGDGPTAARMRSLLGGAGVEAPSGLAWDDPAIEAAGVAVIVGAYAIEPARYVRWLRRDVPHLAVVFGDAGVTVGPLVEPGAGPCLRCHDLRRTDADSAWPAMAAQLFSLPRPGETELVVNAVASVAIAAVLGRLGAEPGIEVGGEAGAGAATLRGARAVAGPWTREAARFDPATGLWTREARDLHPECGCQGLPAVSGCQGLPAVSDDDAKAGTGLRPGGTRGRSP